MRLHSNIFYVTVSKKLLWLKQRTDSGVRSVQLAECKEAIYTKKQSRYYEKSHLQQLYS
jgi:hypothetical protein